MPYACLWSVDDYDSIGELAEKENDFFQHSEKNTVYLHKQGLEMMLE